MNARTMRLIRQWHLYLGLLFAPMLLLFAISGALQVFRLNEEKGYGGTPPAWMVWIAAIHKNQGPPVAKPSKPKADDAAQRQSPLAKGDHAAKDRDAAGPAKKGNAGAALPLKLFALFLAVALAISTILGITIALNSRATRRIGLAMLAIGTVLPIILLKIQG